MSRPISEIEAELYDAEMIYIGCVDEWETKQYGKLVNALRKELAQAKKEATNET
ncbi:hypothetical protein UFOVP785_74 [uncultured Caudovirales phage]|uniref:Uncharacterized protein n=1 Tax=uncultured Caudovirales phage TaxID=2100421 RepID=A0A6J5NV15_9CAUD|nr:hypothetical protein UFOVP785_74 [uncultured Caudovirales phage]